MQSNACEDGMRCEAMRLCSISDVFIRQPFIRSYVVLPHACLSCVNRNLIAYCSQQKVKQLVNFELTVCTKLRRGTVPTVEVQLHASPLIIAHYCSDADVCSRHRWEDVRGGNTVQYAGEKRSQASLTRTDGLATFISFICAITAAYRSLRIPIDVPPNTKMPQSLSRNEFWSGRYILEMPCGPAL